MTEQVPDNTLSADDMETLVTASELRAEAEDLKAQAEALTQTANTLASEVLDRTGVPRVSVSGCGTWAVIPGRFSARKEDIVGELMGMGVAPRVISLAWENASRLSAPSLRFTRERDTKAGA